MKRLKGFLLVLVLVSSAYCSLYSDVVLSDQEAQQVFQTLKDNETSLANWEIQSKLWLTELERNSVVIKNLQSELEQQDKLWKTQLQEASKDKVKVAIIVGVLGLAAGVLGGIVISVSVR